MKINKLKLEKLIKEQISAILEADKPLISDISHGFEAARNAIRNAYPEDSQEFIDAMSVVDMAEKQNVTKKHDINKSAYAWDFIKRSMPADPNIEKKLKNPFLENEDRQSEIKQLIVDMDFEHNHFLRSLIKEFGVFLPNRQDSLESELVMALVQVLKRADR